MAEAAEKEEQRICPLTRPTGSRRLTQDGRPCQKDRCAWWSDRLGTCSVAAVVTVWIETLRRPPAW